MKKIVIFIFTFSFLFTVITFLNYKLEVIENNIKETQIYNKKLERELIFLKTEWEYLNSPENLNFLTSNYLNHKPAELIKFKDFIKILRNKEKENE